MTTSDEAVLAFEDTALTYRTASGTIEALVGVTAAVPKGRFVSVIGPSGCGKSTLLDIAGGLLAPTSGSARLNGEEIRGPRRTTAMVFQEAALLPWRTVRDNIAFGLEAAGVGKKERRDRADSLINLVGLDGFADKHPGDLSGGMRQRVAIARALAVDPEILLMDEPFGALDQQTRMMMGTELTKIWERIRCSVLFVTHDIPEAIALSDEVWVMSQRPARIKERVVIDIPRPRGEDLPLDPRFQELNGIIWKLLRDEANRQLVGSAD
ncbi:ABC transporter ATP-binding protein [Nonomuraea sp. NPDC048826]|uniref:ABC transporter ATP-binding protein n=1 Tax=Nonomuraea sp. NPDC048826 TaxID=3364347 RepID=UPI00371FE47C